LQENRCGVSRDKCLYIARLGCEFLNFHRSDCHQGYLFLFLKCMVKIALFFINRSPIQKGLNKSVKKNHSALLKNRVCFFSSLHIIRGSSRGRRLNTIVGG